MIEQCSFKKVFFYTSANSIDPDQSACMFDVMDHGNIDPFPNKPWFLRVCSTSLHQPA